MPIETQKGSNVAAAPTAAAALFPLLQPSAAHRHPPPPADRTSPAAAPTADGCCSLRLGSCQLPPKQMQVLPARPTPLPSLRLHCQTLEVFSEHLQADVVCHDDFTADCVLRCVVGGAGVELGQQVAGLFVRHRQQQTRSKQSTSSSKPTRTLSEKQSCLISTQACSSNMQFVSGAPAGMPHTYSSASC